MDNVYDVNPEEKNSSTNINITYNRPIFHRRVMANFIDFFLFLVVFLLSFTLFSEMMRNTDDYKSKSNYINEHHLASSLYIQDGDNISSIVTYYDNNDSFISTAKKEALRTAINNFITYIGEEVGEDKQNEIQKNYDEYRLSDTLVKEGVPYFIKNSDNEIVENPSTGEIRITPRDYYDSAYAPYIDNNCQGYLLTSIPLLVDYTNYLSRTILFIDVIPTFIFSGIVVWFMIPLFFRRGYKTLGKVIYKIGAVNNQYLNISKSKFSLRFVLFFFCTIVLSFFTFGVPMIISFSMMSFSKHKQSFSDYMLGIYEVETDPDKIYYTKEEIIYDYLYKDTSSKDFKQLPKL